MMLWFLCRISLFMYCLTLLGTRLALLSETKRSPEGERHKDLSMSPCTKMCWDIQWFCWSPPLKPSAHSAKIGGCVGDSFRSIFTGNFWGLSNLMTPCMMGSCQVVSRFITNMKHHKRLLITAQSRNPGSTTTWLIFGGWGHVWGPLSQWKRSHWWKSTLFSRSPLSPKLVGPRHASFRGRVVRQGRGWGLSQISWMMYNRQTASEGIQWRQWNHVEFCYVQSSLQAATNKNIQYVIWDGFSMIFPCDCEPMVGTFDHSRAEWTCQRRRVLLGNGS